MTPSNTNFDKKCVVHNGKKCNGPVELRRLFGNQIEMPVCLAHYEDMQKVKIED